MYKNFLFLTGFNREGLRNLDRKFTNNDSTAFHKIYTGC
jgi:hypothetical protein